MWLRSETVEAARVRAVCRLEHHEKHVEPKDLFIDVRNEYRAAGRDCDDDRAVLRFTRPTPSPSVAE